MGPRGKSLRHTSKASLPPGMQNLARSCIPVLLEAIHDPEVCELEYIPFTFPEEIEPAEAKGNVVTSSSPSSTSSSTTSTSSSPPSSLLPLPIDLIIIGSEIVMETKVEKLSAIQQTSSTRDAAASANDVENDGAKKIIINNKKTLGIAWPLLSPLHEVAKEMFVEAATATATAAAATSVTSSSPVVTKSSSLYLLHDIASIILLTTPFNQSAWNARKDAFVSSSLLCQRTRSNTNHLASVDEEKEELRMRLLIKDAWGNSRIIAPSASSASSASSPSALSISHHNQTQFQHDHLPESSPSSQPFILPPLLRKQVANELRFTHLIQSRHRKAGEAWAHRRWLLQGFVHVVKYLLKGEDEIANTAVAATTHDLLSSSSASASAPSVLPSPSLLFLSRIFTSEFNQIHLLCHELYSRNYLGWTHRVMCMKWIMLDIVATAVANNNNNNNNTSNHLATETRTTSTSTSTSTTTLFVMSFFQDIFLVEWRKTEKAVRLSPFDYSVWHYRSSVLQCLKEMWVRCVQSDNGVNDTEILKGASTTKNNDNLKENTETWSYHPIGAFLRSLLFLILEREKKLVQYIQVTLGFSHAATQKQTLSTSSSSSLPTSPQIRLASAFPPKAWIALEYQMRNIDTLQKAFKKEEDKAVEDGDRNEYQNEDITSHVTMNQRVKHLLDAQLENSWQE